MRELCALACYDLAALCGGGPASRPLRRLSVSVVASVAIRQSRGFRCAARLRLAASWSASSRDFIGHEKRALPFRVEGTREKRRKRRRRFPSIAARVDTVGCVRLFVGRRAKRCLPHRPAGDAGQKVSRCIRSKGRLVCARVKKKIASHAAGPRGRRKRGTPPFMGGVHMKKRKEYLTDGTGTSFVLCQECPRTGLPVIRWVRQHATRRSKAKP